MRLMVRAAACLGLALAGIANGAVCGRAAAEEEMQIAMPDGTRSAILVPARHARAPTIIVLHGALVSAEHTAKGYGFNRLARRYGFAAVYPRGRRLMWNDGRPAAVGSSADDVGFLRRLTAELAMRGTSDPGRIYLVGVSNGGMMALRMLCQPDASYAGIGIVIASMPSRVGAACQARRATPVIMINGTADPVIPYAGGDVGFSRWQGRVWPAEQTAGFFARRNGCGTASSAVVAGRAKSALRVVRLDWAPCNSGRRVTLYRVEGGGHQVFGRTNFLPTVLGRGTKRLSSPDLIMAAFAGWHR